MSEFLELTSTDQASTTDIEHANECIQEIDDQIVEIDRIVRECYKKRFPELTVANPTQYFKVVKLLANDPAVKVADEEMKDNLSLILDPKTHFLVLMTAATNQGRELSPKELANVLESCDEALKLVDRRNELLKFVELNMTKIAPNLSLLLGPSVAAKLVVSVGGLHELVSIPACNISFIGSEKKSSLGVSSIEAPSSKMGFIYYSDIVQRVPLHHTKDIRKRAVRLIAAKCVLAARCDANKSFPKGTFGQECRDDIDKKIRKYLEPPPKKAVRPLPLLIDKPSKKRGGKRYRRTKAQYAATALRRSQNRMKFGEISSDM